MNARPHNGAFIAFPNQNDKCPTNTRRGMCTLGIDWAILLCPAFVRSSRVKQIRRSNSDRAAGVEKTRLIKHSMGTDTQARRIITVSNIDQVIFLLIMLTHCFFPATIQLAKCNVLMTRDTIDLDKPLSNKMLCSTPVGCDTKLVSSCASFNSSDIKKKALRHSCTTPPDCINSTSQDWDMVVQRLPWLEKMEKFFENVINGLYLAYA